MKKEMQIVVSDEVSKVTFEAKDDEKKAFELFYRALCFCEYNIDALFQESQKLNQAIFQLMAKNNTPFYQELMKMKSTEETESKAKSKQEAEKNAEGNPESKKIATQ